MIRKPGYFLIFLCLVSCATARKHRHKINHKHRQAVKRQTNSYDNYLTTDNNQNHAEQSYNSYSYGDQSTAPNYSSEQTSSQNTSSSSSPVTPGDQSSQYSSSSSDDIYESQPDWCQDNKMCPNFHKSDCKKDEWVMLNCARKCDLCYKHFDDSTYAAESPSQNTSTDQSTPYASQTSVQATYQDVSANASQSPYFMQAANPSQSTNSTLSTDADSGNSSTVNDNKLSYKYTMEVDDLSQPKPFTDETEMTNANRTSAQTAYQDVSANTSRSSYFMLAASPFQSTNSTLSTDADNGGNSSTVNDYKLSYKYTMEVDDLPQPKPFTAETDKTKERKRPSLDEEDINITLPSDMRNKDSESISKPKPPSKKLTGAWCKDSDKCLSLNSSQCNGNTWMQLNCPKKCEICAAVPDSHAQETVIQGQNTARLQNEEKTKKLHKEYMEDIRVTLPSGMLSVPEACEDHVECIEYPVSSCHQEWMKQNCRSKCALCEGKGKKIPETKTEEYTLSKTGDNSGVCYYDGVPHEHGSKWSPGPCTPECVCENGNVRCTVIQCPKLTCDRQVKKRWSCCLECSDEDESCVKAVEATSKNSTCCVLPFVFKGVQYETCTDEKHVEPWCSLTENFDLDGKWGVCVEPKPVSTTVDHYAMTKPDTPVQEQKPTIKDKPRHLQNHTVAQNHSKPLPEPDKEQHQKTHHSKGKTVVDKALESIKPEHVQEPEEEEEILRKYGSKAEKEEPYIEPEALDGGYTEWSAWTACLTTCGGGVQERIRKCTRPPPMFGGLDCKHIGPATESRECNTAACPVNGAFSSWSPWVECSTTCGGGVTTRSRLCDNPIPKYGGKDCVVRGLGAAIESKTCSSFPCTDAGAFTPWSEWSKCDRKCGGGITFRRRTCTSSLPNSNGRDCSLRGTETETKSCNPQICAVDGGYTTWTAWSACSQSCGPGITSRHRTCTQPAPTETGKDCSALGQAFEQKSCTLSDCIASGNWTSWSDWSKCSVDCGGGLQTRSRKCVGKIPCEGSDRQSQLCNAYHCPIHGDYTEWSAWGTCSKSCGEGLSTRTRKCTNPAPRFGGKTCDEQTLGPNEEVQKCNARDCEVSRDGGYSSWSPWTQCSMTCGLGTMTRYRACDHPSPQGIGKDCTHLGVGIQTAPCFNQGCPVHGNYTKWSDWSQCSVSCGDGSRFRTRTCTNPEPQSGGNSCKELGDDVTSESCFDAPCPVDAKLGEWSAWSGCTKTCGYGIRRRKRRCLGSSQFEESYCDQMGLGLTQQAERCFERSCPVDGNFGPWSAWSTCSTTCGGGAMSRFRNCSDPVPMHGGRGCERVGASFEIKSCRDNYCPVDGGFSNWSEFGPCSRTCGSGSQKRTRTCSSPPPEHGGKDCSEIGSIEDVRECATDPCPINGNYTDWSEWSNCSSSCGNGIMVRSRSCNSPAPTLGGQECTSLGPDKEQQNCIMKACQEHCSCGGWTTWSECGRSCGGGYQTRRRQCTPPKSGIESCENEEQETQLCNLNVCPVDGGYNPWSAWSSCIGECGTGHKSRSRECNNPVAAFGGRPCQEVGLGQAYETARCVKDPCPVHGKYSSWSPWSACSSTCGLGQKKRTRACDNPAPSNGGLGCFRYGRDEDAVDCFVADCPVDGAFSPWTEWSECSKSCGWGHQSRERECNSPEPSHGGRDCTAFGDSMEVQPCIMVECPVDGKYTAWAAWGECSKTCGEGVKRRKRYCSSPKPDFGGRTCGEQKLGDTSDVAKCNLGPCAEPGGWSAWSAWSYCSASCGRGKMERSRQCDSPEPVGGGKPCVGLLTQQKDCSLRDCPVNGNYTNWGAWTQCDAKCGRGFQTRWRSCSNPVATGGGDECTTFGPDFESKPCFNKPCKMDGSWGQWSEWSACSKSCGDGIQVRTRRCEDPRPEAGGATCVGISNDEKYCRLRECCDIPYVDLGCFVDTGNPSTMPEILLTDTDTNSPLFSGVQIKRGMKEWDDYMPNLICRCAQITNEKGYSHFGIQNLGECRSGIGADRNFASQGARVAFSNQGRKPWVGCVGKGFRQCRRPSLNCVGQDQTNYVYGLKNISPVNGNYTAWSAWSPCSKSCGRGISSRRRSCTNPPALYDGKDCSDIGPEEQIQECVMKTCPVNGAWSGWAMWSECSSSCGTGKRTRIRGCSSPKPSFGGDLCSGPDTEIAECYRRDCPVDGRWSDWQAWEPCSVSCGSGVQLRTRYCNNPPPRNGGQMCEGDLVESAPCEAKPCPVHGNYADWSNWSGCSRSCGRGSKVRVRKCINPVPRFGGHSCERLAPSEEKTHCNAYPCPVHGNWEAWSSWSVCSSECGPGVRRRDRRCNNPYPNYGGKPCVGKAHETTVCSKQDCPIDGNWGAWSEWSDCQNDCGVATRQRTRACIDPPPAHGGKGCEGVAEEYHDCKLDHCPIDGAYSQWSSWSGCDQSCGSGHKLRVRSCSDPEPQFGGANCSTLGPEVESVACNTDPCPVDGAWSGWSSWSSCSQTCGLGTTTRSRSCSYPVAEFGGKVCAGKSKEKKPCKDFDCCDVPYKDVGCYIDTQRNPRPLPELLFSDRDKISWKKWKSFMSDLICKCAEETRNKRYTHFGIQHYGECYSGGESWKTYKDEGLRQDFTRPPDSQPWVGCVDETLNQCKEPNLECVGKQNTNYVYTVDQVSPVDGNYSNWSAWSTCSSSCGPGSRYRIRSCTNPPPSFSGQPCYIMGSDEEIETCFKDECPIDGGWGNWGDWSKCSETCGKGRIERARACDNPKPQHGGKNCEGQTEETVECNLHECPVRGMWSAWSAWSQCSSSCGNGQQSRKRECNNPKAKHGGEPCLGSSVVFQNCVEKECPGIWGDWSDWSECSRTCGTGGTHTRSRTCQGGKLCHGPRHENKQCQLQQCPECSKSADVAFILDGSAATDESVWNRIKSFARGIANAFVLHDDATRVGLITYSNQPTLELQFDEKNDRDEFSDFLNTVSARYGSSDLESALAVANRELFVPEAGMRTKVPNVAVILSEEGPTLSFNGYNDSARDLKEKGVTVIGVGVGDNVNQYALQRVTTSPEHTFVVGSLEDAIASIAAVANATCIAKPTPPQVKWGPWSDWSTCSRLCDAGVRHRSRSCLNGNDCVGENKQESACVLQRCPACKSTLDVVFAIPVADSIPKQQLNDAKKFVRGVIDGLTISPQGTHVGLLGYFDYPRVELKLDTFYDKEDILRALSAMSIVDGFNQTRIDSALRAAQADMFSQANGVRSYIPKVLVFLASGDASDQNLKAASMPLKSAGTTIIPLVVGALETRTVAPMGTSTNHYFASDTFDNLASKLDKISLKLCTAPQSFNQPYTKATGVTTKVIPHIHGISKLFLKGEKQHIISKPNAGTSARIKPISPLQNMPIQGRPANSGIRMPVKTLAQVPQTVAASAQEPKLPPPQDKNRPAVDLTHVLTQPYLKAVASKPVNITANPLSSTGMWKDWSAWSTCSKSCGLGKSNRYRLCDNAKCQGRPPFQSSPCKLQDCPVCNYNLDLVLAVDSSNAVSKDDWKMVKTFMTGILDAFRVSEADTHVGVLTFSSVPYLETRLGDNFKKDDIKLLVNNMQQLQGKQRRIDKALRMAVAEFFAPKARGFRENVSKAFLLITGGNPTEGSEGLASAIRPLQQNGVTVVAVGIGRDIDETQLRSFGRVQENYIKVSKYEDLPSYMYPVVSDLCKAGHVKPPPIPAQVPKVSSSKMTPPPISPLPTAGKKLRLPAEKIASLINKWGMWGKWTACSKTCGEGQRSRTRDCVGYNCTGPSVEEEACFLQDCPDCQKGIDLVFAVDGSNDVIDKEFMQEKSFVMNVLNAFKISKDQTHIGVSTYGSDVAEDIPLTNQFDKDSLFVAVNSLIRSKGGNNLAKVLGAARNKLFTGARANSAKVLVILTSDKNKILNDKPDELSKGLKKFGIDVVAVGVGSSDKTARDMLSKIATSPSRVFPVASFDELVNNVYLVATSACQVSPPSLAADQIKRTPTQPSICSAPVDVAFALDSSEDVNSFQWQQQKDFVKKIIDGFRIAPDGVHTGLVAYAAMPSVNLKLNVRNRDKQQLLENVDGISRAVGRRNIGSLLDMSKYEVFSPQSGRRPKTPSALVVLQFGTDRPDSKNYSLKRTAESLRKDGVRIYVVGVGSKISRANMASYASSPLDIMHLPSLNRANVASKLIKTLCTGTKSNEETVQPLQRHLPSKNITFNPKTGPKPSKALSSAKPVKKLKSVPSQNTTEQLNQSNNKAPAPAIKPVTLPSKTSNTTSLSTHSVMKNESKKIVDIVARSCRELKRRIRGAEDGEFPIMFNPHCGPVKLYCHGMDTENPAEYLTLPRGEDNNYASFHKERLKDFHNCDGPIDPSPALTAKYWGTSRFSKIRINPKNGLIKQDDFRFAVSQGNPVKFGRGGDCFSLGECRRGGFKIDLTGTGLKLQDDVRWTSWGTPKTDSRMINFTRSPDNVVISAVCGGSCGGCQPSTGRIYLTPSSCETPVGTLVKRSVLEAMEVLNKPAKNEKERRQNIHRYSNKSKQKIHKRRNHATNIKHKYSRKHESKNNSKKHSVKHRKSRKNGRKH